MDFKNLIQRGSSDKVIESVILQKILFNKRKKNIEDKLVFFERSIADLSLHEKYYIGSLIISLIERNDRLLNNENLGNNQKKIVNQNILELKKYQKSQFQNQCVKIVGKKFYYVKTQEKIIQKFQVEEVEAVRIKCTINI